ncbi:MAG TPA: response regulator [Chthoniobacteraceae bacterium]|jgi:CheY-like chemotaxis protein|nr:response regulator [Chthoniobacteraceae bacterium]
MSSSSSALGVPPENRLLIAEDHEASRRILQAYLQARGFEVVATDNGTEAANILEGENPPSIALLDWMMPGTDGVEVCRRVRSLGVRPYTYLVLLTSRSGKDEVAEGLEAGADDYVTKPCDRDELRARLAVGQRVVKLERALAARVVELETALSEVRRLKRLLPICMYCKRIRDDRDYWRQLEEYIHLETGTNFSHGICPQCMSTLPELRDISGGGATQGA